MEKYGVRSLGSIVFLRAYHISLLLKYPCTYSHRVGEFPLALIVFKFHFSRHIYALFAHYWNTFVRNSKYDPNKKTWTKQK